MHISIIPVGPFEENCAIVWKMQEQALVIDPGSEEERLIDLLKQHGLTPAAYLLTHGHADHLNALAGLHRVFPAPVYLHPRDESWAFSPRNSIEPWYPAPERPDQPVLPPADVEIAGFRIQVIETPGHTPGGVCYYFPEEKTLFSGDTLFKGSCGRTDLPGGDGRVLMQSLRKLAALPDAVTVYSGHGESTTIGHEKKTSFFMQQAAR